MRMMVAALSICCVACAVMGAEDEPSASVEHLKPYGSLIGTWRYEGPSLEDVPGVAEKGTDFVLQLQWRGILNKHVVEERWLVEFENGMSFSGKNLIGWNAAKEEIALGGMNSVGGMGLGTVVFDKAAKSMTITAKGIDQEGNETASKIVVTKTAKDTLTWQALERKGPIVNGPSPIYTLKRVPRAKDAAN